MENLNEWGLCKTHEVHYSQETRIKTTRFDLKRIKDRCLELAKSAPPPEEKELTIEELQEHLL